MGNSVTMKGKNDEVIAALKNPVIYSDLFNGYIFEGKQVIRPEDLEDKGIQQMEKMETRAGKTMVVKRFRDLKKEGTVDSYLVVLAVEGQREVHYGMPLRVMLYDAMDYLEQIKELEKEHNKYKDWSDSKEFLSGMKKEDRLTPVITLVLFYGQDQEWDGPRCLHDMLNIPEEYKKWKEYLPDYPLHLVSSKTVNGEHFQTGLREVFELLGVAADEDKMKQLLEEKKEHYSNLDREKSDLIATFLNIPTLKEKKQEYHTKEGGVNMCIAIDKMMKDNYEQGMEQGKETQNIDLICKNLDRGMSIKDISYWMELEEDYVAEIAQIHKEHPSYDADTIRKYLRK